MINIVDLLVWLQISSIFEGYSTFEVTLWGLVLLSGFFGALGGIYLLYVDTVVVHYPNFFRIIAVGLIGFVISAPAVFFLNVEFIHGVHGFAALVVAIGLYSLLREEVIRGS